MILEVLVLFLKCSCSWNRVTGSAGREERKDINTPHFAAMRVVFCLLLVAIWCQLTLVTATESYYEFLGISTDATAKVCAKIDAPMAKRNASHSTCA